MTGGRIKSTTGGVSASTTGGGIRVVTGAGIWSITDVGILRISSLTLFRGKMSIEVFYLDYVHPFGDASKRRKKRIVYYGLFPSYLTILR